MNKKILILCSSRPRRQDPERFSVEGAQSPKVPPVEREDVARAMTARENHDRCIGDSDLEIGVLLDDLDRGAHIRGCKRLQPIGPTSDLGKQSSFGLYPHVRR